MTYLQQLESWVAGTPIHAEQCCPDFSCCQPQFLAPKDIRELFLAAYKAGNEALTMRLCMEFLSRAFSGENIYIAGLEASRREVEGA